MSSLEVRNNSAMMKRAEQLKRWEESDTNRAAPSPRHEHSRRIKFSSGCVFLAACLSGDKEEVVQLLEQGADINTANVDGLTALHQACIDDKLDMVEFLIEHGADINRQDNEGWTPLHATASCGFVSIACYLVEHNADVAAVNSDGDLALDLAIDVQHMPMINYMEKVVQELNIDVDQARRAEEQAMLKDAKRGDLSEVDRPHPKTGATALHVAAAKGYAKVLRLLLAAGCNVDRQDNDGWTPLHAAAHWGQKEAAEMLVESLADMDITNYAGQTCIDVADRKMVKFLEELRANKRNKRRPSSQIRISDAIENHVDKTRTKLVRVEVRTDTAKDAENVKPNQHIHAAEHSGEEEAPWRRKTLRTPNDSPTKNQVPDKELSGKSANETANDVILRRTQSFENDQKKPIAPATMLTAATTTTTTTTTTLSSPASTVLTPPIRRSFVPPVRDEESETQRKAHAKRVRETRRSTQGVTLEEIKSAEELVKKKNLGMNNNNNNNNNNSSSNETSSTTATPATPSTTTATTTTATAVNNSSENDIDDSSQPEAQPPPPPTSPPPAIIPRTATTADDSEIIEAVVGSADTTASFTLAPPAHTHAAGEDDDQQTAVSASYTIVSRREKPVESETDQEKKKQEAEESSSHKQLKTDPVVAKQARVTGTEASGESTPIPARPTELPLAAAAPTESRAATTPTPVTTPGSLESPVRLRDKRNLSSSSAGGSAQDADGKSDTASPVAAHADFNARDSLLSLYARRTMESGAGGAGGAATSAAATVVAPSTSSSSSTSISAAERRPSWRLKFDAGSKFKLEDITSGGTYPPNQSTIIPSAPAVMAAVNLASTAGSQRRISSGPNALNASNQSLNSVGRPVSAPSESINNSAYVTPPARRYETSTLPATATTTATATTATTATTANNSATSASSANHATATSHEDKDNDKENDNRTQTVIQRRRKPKRRSTGVVHIDMDEIDPERQHETANNDNEDKEKESGSERTSRSRTGSTATASTGSDSKSSSNSDKAENGDGIDYKALWEAAKLENDKLKQLLKQKDEEAVQTRATLERFANATTKNSLSEIEKRERRAMERKVSELEEELKLLQKLKTENDRLRAENRALTRVVSKLTTSAQSQLAKSK
ncbi:PREDICTED: protein phosphatase 1 regulatory subunit 12A isoform X14 [Drosophila arizonae]|uniref:Protein phosphatase 1 regulatory subunit 12A isoform X14 n=1 Tax=Drosophila arizonae TaxID=7263 RepID=A0ABM1P6C4_DROAR|nr:PREDICTED: protein phosphatase 1 regulatory subunit 12A isoform X14 [Drosophila arizonae]